MIYVFKKGIIERGREGKCNIVNPQVDCCLYGITCQDLILYVSVKLFISTVIDFTSDVFSLLLSEPLSFLKRGGLFIMPLHRPVSYDVKL